LRSAVEGGALPPRVGYAVTPALREWYAEGDSEDLEDAARALAAEASLRLLAADAAAPRQRVVLVVEVDDAGSDPNERGAVRLRSPAPRSCWAAGLVDDGDAVETVAAAAGATIAAHGGDPDAQFVVSEAEDLELLWYATQELDDL
jgi:hypothetical protein